MKRFLILIMIFLPIVAGGQVVSSVGLTANLAEQKVVTETTAMYENWTGYAYNEINTRGAWYGQFFVEHKWWNYPVFLHAEYRGVMDCDWYENTALLGLAWCHYGKHGFLAIEPLALWRERMGFGGQISVVGGWEWKYFEIQHYTDIWRTSKMSSPVDVYNEGRFYFKAGKRLCLGLIGTMYWMVSESPNLALYAGIKFKL